MKLVDWLVSYIKYRDSVHRRVKDIVKDGDVVKCFFKDDSVKIYVCFDYLNDVLVKDYNDDVNVFVCFNSKNNLDWLVNNWSFLKSKKLTFFFVNPSRAMHWAVNTDTHDFVTEKASLKLGLKALFDSVPEV